MFRQPILPPLIILSYSTLDLLAVGSDTERGRHQSENYLNRGNIEVQFRKETSTAPGYNEVD